MRGIGRIRYIRTAQNVKGYLQCPTNNYQDISLVCQCYTKFSNLLALATSCYREHKPEGAKIIQVQVTVEKIMKRHRGIKVRCLPRFARQFHQRPIWQEGQVFHCANMFSYFLIVPLLPSVCYFSYSFSFSANGSQSCCLFSNKLQLRFLGRAKNIRAISFREATKKTG